MPLEAPIARSVTPGDRLTSCAVSARRAGRSFGIAGLLLAGAASVLAIPAAAAIPARQAESEACPDLSSIPAPALQHTLEVRYLRDGETSKGTPDSAPPSGRAGSPTRPLMTARVLSRGDASSSADESAVHFLLQHPPETSLHFVISIVARDEMERLSAGGFASPSHAIPERFDLLSKPAFFPEPRPAYIFPVLSDSGQFGSGIRQPGGQ